MSAIPVSKSSIAGILAVVSGAAGLIGAAIVGAIGAVTSGVLAGIPDDVPAGISLLPLAIFVPLAAFLVVMAVLSIAGGVAALRRRSWTLAVVGAAAAVFCFMPLGIAALVLLVLGQQEFPAQP